MITDIKTLRNIEAKKKGKGYDFEKIDVKDIVRFDWIECATDENETSLIKVETKDQVMIVAGYAIETPINEDGEENTDLSEIDVCNWEVTGFEQCTRLTGFEKEQRVSCHKKVRSGGRNTLLINITDECRRLGVEYGEEIKITIEKA